MTTVSIRRETETQRVALKKDARTAKCKVAHHARTSVNSGHQYFHHTLDSTNSYSGIRGRNVSSSFDGSDIVPAILAGAPDSPSDHVESGQEDMISAK